MEAAAVLSRQFVWTAIPAGRIIPRLGRQVGVVSVLVTPRLFGPSGAALTLKSFGMDTWPKWLNNTGFTFTCGSADVDPGKVQRIPHGFTLQQQLSVWAAVFGASMTVTPYRAASYAGRPVRVFPAAAAVTEVRNAYSATGRAYARYSAPGSEGQLQRALADATAEWQGRLAADAGDTDDSEQVLSSALDQAFAFYQRDRDVTPLEPRLAAAEEQREFHTTVARLADHPVLLRALGLLLDFGIDATVLNGQKVLSVRPMWSTAKPPGWTNTGLADNPTRPDLSPSTAYVVTGTRFVPDSTGSPIVDGVLAIRSAGLAGEAGSRFESLSFDIDGAALRMVGAGRADRRDARAAAGNLPALRSAGVSLVDRGRTSALRNRISRSAPTSADLLAQPLLAGDLVGGYRIDIEDVGTWLSTCQRRVSYTVGGQPLGSEVVEEGYVRPDALTTGAGPHDALYVHELVARWDGYSLAVQRPGRTAPTGDSMPPTPADPPFRASDKVEPGSLPRLRFGRTYHMRVRIADLAGGGLGPSELLPADNAQSLEFTHQRFEPIPPPEILPAADLAAGEALDRMIVHDTRTTARRHLVCPSASLELALQHSVFDAALGPHVTDQDIDKFFAIATRADKTATDIPGARLAGTGEARYVVVPGDAMNAPWLPDPAAERVIIAVRRRPPDPDGNHLPGIDGIPTRPNWASWPDRPAIRLELVAVESGCKATTSPDHRVVRVELGRAQQLTLNILSTMKPTDVGKFGVARWISAGHAEDDMVRGIADSGNPLVTPSRELTLVHAVQKPLAAPTGNLDARRTTAGTDAVLVTSGLTVHIPSTGRLEISAAWTDPDQTPGLGPGGTTRTAALGSFTVEQTLREKALPVIRHEFADTRRRKITYTVTAVSRFEDCYPDASAAACRVVAPFKVDVPSTARPPAPDVSHCVPSFHWSTDVTADGKVRRLRRGGRIRVYLQPPWYVTGAEEMLAVLISPHSTTGVEVPPDCSFVGRDPVWLGSAIPTLLMAQHLSAPVTFTADNAQSPAHPGVAYPVESDSAARRWYADVDLSPYPGRAYCPFVRLALARYQARTTDTRKLALSEVTRTEPIQLLPDRQLEITPDTANQQLKLRLTGVGPVAPRDRSVVTAEVQVYDDDSGQPPSGQAASEVIGSPGWTTVVTASDKLNNTFSIHVPAAGGRPRRIMITEAESYPPPPDSGSPVDGPARLIYADIIAIGPGGQLDTRNISHVDCVLPDRLDHTTPAGEPAFGSVHLHRLSREGIPFRPGRDAP
ncbi:hypothetical protein NG2371_03399 [Nocardia gamkensis]|uniref:Uncharacterized protein n=2 Tax=Nocardia gamkensis TaxID=352869 RepID=A0A7X6L100_9NOCA|nr:hypothetical protein [Nocardia gamkensis]NKY25872.1 hypothetical protein [Nocardia gamkensis]NQE68935.1 hypothetical protein [Nocardia gamkensis]